jgi:hypothetical protein
MSVNGSNWIPTVFLYKWKWRKEGFANFLPGGSTFSVTPKVYKTAEEFCNYLRHFKHHQVPGKILVGIEMIPLFLLKRIFYMQELCHPAYCLRAAVARK